MVSLSSVALGELRLRATRARIAELATVAAAPPTLGSIRLQSHQRLAVARVIQALARDGGCLLADDVGRGKTYVALAVARQWRRPLAVVPASLRQTWQRAMERAHVSCALVTHEALSRGTLPALEPDGIIVDESHRFRSPDAKRHAALARIAAYAPVLLLSATPVQNGTRDLAAQLAFFLGSSAFTRSEAALARFVIRGADGDEGIDLPQVAPPTWLHIAHDDGAVLRAILALPSPARPFDAGDAGALRVIGLVRAWASSRAALAAALRRRAWVATALEQCASSGLSPTRRDLRAWQGVDGDVQLALAPLLISRAESDGGNALLDAVAAERTGLDQLATVLRAAPDPDVARVAALRALRAEHPGARILAFSEFATTVRAYFALLRAEAGIGMLTASEARIASGRLPREALLERFAPVAQGAAEPVARERVTLLLATDLLSEGVNLQDASIVVHLDLPWNPARLAQRLGRVRRPGGASVVRSHLMAPPAQSELLLRVDARLRAKLARAERAIGRTLEVMPALASLPSTTRASAADDVVVSQSAESIGEELDQLARWRRVHACATRAPAPLVAAVQCDEAGWLASLTDGRLLARCGSVSANTGVAVSRAVVLACGLGRPCDVDERMRALAEAGEWLERERLVRACGVHESASPMDAVMERCVARVVHRAARHQRAALLGLAARLRDTLGGPRPLGAERELATLLEAHTTSDITHTEWLERSINVTSRHTARYVESDAPQVAALIVLGPAPIALRQRGDQRAMRPLGPTAHPLPSAANATLLYGTESTGIQVAPPSRDRSVPVSPTATSRLPSPPGTNATAER